MYKRNRLKTFLTLFVAILIAWLWNTSYSWRGRPDVGRRD